MNKETLFTVWGKVDLIRAGDTVQVIVNNSPMFSVPIHCLTRLVNLKGGDNSEHTPTKHSADS